MQVAVKTLVQGLIHTHRFVVFVYLHGKPVPEDIPPYLVADSYTRPSDTTKLCSDLFMIHRRIPRVRVAVVRGALEVRNRRETSAPLHKT
jgi:hypothetical protein